MQKTVRVLKKARGAFLTCFILGLLLVLLAAAYSLYTNATNEEVFKEALLNADVGELMEIVLGNAGLPAGLGASLSLGGDQQQATAELLSKFAKDTIDYLVDNTQEWKPTITVMGMEMAIPLSEDFVAHMATVKGFVEIGTKAFLALLAVAGVLLLRVFFSSRRGRSGFSGAGYYIGVFLPVALVLGVVGWAYFDFEGFWAFLHQYFIPDGIFSNGEVIMQIFTTDMFKSFMLPIVKTFGMLLGGIVLLPVLVSPLCNLFKGSVKKING